MTNAAIPHRLHLLRIGGAADTPTAAELGAALPGWEVLAWTDEDLDHVAWRSRARMAAALAAQGADARDEVAALMRWEILAEHGGVALLPDRPLPAALAARVHAGGAWAEDAAEGWAACAPGHPVAQAAVDAAAGGPAPARGLLNIVVMTIRTSALMRRIVETLAESCRAHPGVRLTVADGAQDADKARWLAGLAARGGDLRVIHEPSALVRFGAALTDAHDWTLLVADDDPFSLDYVDVFLDHLAGVSPQVGLVAPSAYVRRLGALVACSQVEPVRATAMPERLAAWLAQGDAQGLAYYAAVRTPVFQEWYRYLRSKPYDPSYVDQLLTALAAQRGGLEPVRGCNALTRDDGNWADGEAWVRSDMRFYPRPDLVLLHELFWVADLVRLLGVAGRPAVAQAVRPRALRLLAAWAELWPLREQLAAPRPGLDWAALRAACVTLARHLAQAEEPAAIEQAFLRIEAFARATESSLLAD